MSATPASFLLWLTLEPITTSHSDLEHAACVRRWLRVHASVRVCARTTTYAVSGAGREEVLCLGSEPDPNPLAQRW